MNCRQVMTHTVREGESFYTIAKYYQVPMEDLMALNPGLNPYNLMVGTQMTVCLDQYPPEENAGETMDWEEYMEVSNEMREVWEQHVYWTRMLMLSIFGRMEDQAAVTDRLMRNPMDIADVFGDFYSQQVVDQIAGLLAEHLRIGGALMTAVRDRNTAQVTSLNDQWYTNADQMAAAFASINSMYQEEEVRSMLYRHLDLLKMQIAERMAGNYAADIQAFDEGEDHILDLADYFTYGLVQQLY